MYLAICKLVIAQQKKKKKNQYASWTFGCCMWLADISMYFTQHVGLRLYIPQDHMVVIEL